MAVKVEMQKNEAKGILALAFECSKEDELDIIDAVRAAMFGDFDKQCGYVSSKRLVVHIKMEEPVK
jgi:hypothetical protein